MEIKLKLANSILLVPVLTSSRQREAPGAAVAPRCCAKAVRRVWGTSAAEKESFNTYICRKRLYTLCSTQCTGPKPAFHTVLVLLADLCAA